MGWHLAEGVHIRNENVTVTAQLHPKIAEWFRDADWRNPEHYPSPKTASFDRWAWEFLRRNEDFKKGFADIIEIKKRNPWGAGSCPLDHPARIAQKKLCTEWGIKMFYPNTWIADAPDKHDSPCRFKTSGADSVWAPYHFDGNEQRFYIVPYVSHEFLYPVNLNWPIEPQIQAIKRNALTNQKSRAANNLPKPTQQVRHHVKNFPTYLRAFDAFKACATAHEIADVFSEEKLSLEDKDYEQGAYNADASARRLIEGDYRFIPYKKFSKTRISK